MPVKISVVIPTFRSPSLLQKCLHSLNEQCFNKQEFEVIVVNDGPDDATRELVQHFFRQSDIVIRYFMQDKKRGPAAARNIGWQRAVGWLVAFTDDDCIPDTDWLHDLWYAYKGETLIAYSGTLKVPVPARPTDYEINSAGLEKASFVTANCCCTKKALELTGGFDERFSMAWREDSDLEFKLLQHKIPIVKLANAIVVHPVRKAKWGVSIPEQRKGMYNALLYKKYPKQYRHKIQSRPPLNYYGMVLLVVVMVTALLFGKTSLVILSFSIWLLLIARLVFKRLSGTSHSASHIAEMIVTSMIIPFASVYWQLYGAWRFKVLFF
jgi:glycosyltransferase involved in cell wall biosynthesis